MGKKTILVSIGVTLVCAFLAYAFVLLGANQADALTDAIRSCDGAGDRKQQCFHDLVMREAETKSVNSGFEAVARLYVHDAEFAEFCHGNVHELGKLAYERYTRSGDATISSYASFCGFGFFHGFLEALVAENGDLKAAERFCESAEAELRHTLPGVSFACYHGIGHGVVDGSDPRLWGDAASFIREGLHLCNAISGIEERRERCASGVFNALAIAYRIPRYHIPSDPHDPYAICREQDTSYVREACYNQMNLFVTKTTETFEEALQRAESTAESAYAAVAIEAIGAIAAKEGLALSGGALTFLNTCAILAETLRTACVNGLAMGFIEHGTPGKEYENAIDACHASSISDDVCFHGVAVGVRDRLSEEHRNAACEYMGRVSERAQEDCLVVIGGAH